MSRAIVGAIALGIAATVGGTASAREPFETVTLSDTAVTLSDTAVTLTEVLGSSGIPADAEPVASQVVLKGSDGKLTPLLRDAASRAHFRDGRMRNGRTEIVGGRFRGLPFSQVVSFEVEEQGTLRTPEYDCDLWKIRVRFPQTCPCCQGKMESRMKPVPQ